MAPVPVKCIISFSSQDAKHPAENLVKGLSVLKWLGSPADRSGRLEATFQLQNPCVLGFIDVGTIWVASMQILVGKSTWSANEEYKTLLSGVQLMNPKDCRQEQNKQKLSMFKYDAFHESVRDESWDRIKVILTQPFRKDRQMGISLLKFTPKEEEITSTEKVSLSRSPLLPKKLANISPGLSEQKSKEEIKRHFLGNKNTRNKLDEQVKSKLLKMEGSAENGVEKVEGMSRHARLVMAAVSRTPVYKTVGTNEKAGTRSAPPRLRKKQLTIEEEVDGFLKRLNFEEFDLMTMTFAGIALSSITDLRHQFEKQKCRKLSKEEKKLFKDKTTTFINEQEEKLTRKASPKQEKQNRKVEDSPKDPDEKLNIGLGASPELQKKRPAPRRSFLSQLPSPSQNLKLSLDSTQTASVGSVLELSKTQEKQSCSKVPSTQDLKLRLNSQISDDSSKLLSPPNTDTQTTQDLKLQLESQTPKDVTSQAENDEELKLRLESSTEEHASTFVSEGKSTVKEQRSFIAQVQEGFKTMVSKVLKKSDGIVRENRSLGDHSKDKKHIPTSKNISLVNSESFVKEDEDANNDDVWLNKENAKISSNEVSFSSLHKGNKRKSETSCENLQDTEGRENSRKRRRKSKGGKKETCKNCRKSFSRKEMEMHKQLCGELSSNSEAEIDSVHELSSQVQLMLEERSFANSSQSTSEEITPTPCSRVSKASKRESGKTKCPGCKKMFSYKEIDAHMPICDQQGAKKITKKHNTDVMYDERGNATSDRQIHVQYEDHEDMGVCPVCNQQFTVTILPGHVERCLTRQEDISQSHGECPICAKQFSITTLESHVNQCMDMLAA